jgi:hypothetical protein
LLFDSIPLSRCGPYREITPIRFSIAPLSVLRGSKLGTEVLTKQ